MLKTLLFICAIAVAIGAGAVHLVNTHVPAANSVLYGCLAQEAELAPTHRMLACECLAGEVATAFWTAREFVLPVARREALRSVALNTCRALSFEQIPGDRGPTRMSPMPSLKS